jgi:hypothetical protein
MRQVPSSHLDVSIAANDIKDLWFAAPLVLDTTDFLVGGASAGATINIQGSGEIGIA